MKRRDFFVRVGGIFLAAPVVAKLGGCGDDGGDDGDPVDSGNGNVDAPVDAPAVDAPADASTADAPAPDCTQGTVIAIGTNHGHTGDIPAADVAAGVEKTYNIQGRSPHPHTVTVTAADFQMLQQGAEVVLTSTLDAGHTHSFTVRCAPAA